MNGLPVVAKREKMGTLHYLNSLGQKKIWSKSLNNTSKGQIILIFIILNNNIIDFTGLRPELLEKRLCERSFHCFCKEIGPKIGLKGQFKRNISTSNSPKAQRMWKAWKKKKRKKMFATFPFKGCKPPRYHMKIANIRIRMSMPPKHQSEWKLARLLIKSCSSN